MLLKGRTGTKNKFQNPHYVSDMYDFYIEGIDKNSKYYVDRKLFRTIVEEYITFINDSILDGHIFYLPNGMGQVYVNKRKVIPGKVGMSVDWVLYEKYGKLIRHLNEHSNGYKYNFKWNKGTCKFRNNVMYRLTMVRNMKRTLARYIIDLKKDYMEDK